MRKGWTRKKIGDLIAPLTTIDPRKEPNKNFTYIDVSSVSRSSHEITETSLVKGSAAPSRARRLVKSGDVIFATIRPTLQRIAQIPNKLDGAVCSTGYSVLRPKPEIFAKFLFYSLFTPEFFDSMTALQRGAAYPAVGDGDVKEQELSIPPLPEQKHIVAILDEAFAGIDAAITNTEKNLANARELFESYLNSVFSRRGEGWKDTSIGCQITLQRGFDITKKDQKPGNIPVVSSGGIKSYHDTAKVEGPGVVIGRKGSLGTVHFVEDDYWPHDTTLWVKDFKDNNVRLVYYLLKSMDLKMLDTGTANPALNRNLVHPIRVSWPAREVQEDLVQSLDSVADEAQRLESVCQRKLIALTELKQSLLQKAFSGELTADKAVSGLYPKEEVA